MGADRHQNSPGNFSGEAGGVHGPLFPGKFVEAAEKGRKGGQNFPGGVGDQEKHMYAKMMQYHKLLEAVYRALLREESMWGATPEEQEEYRAAVTSRDFLALLDQFKMSISPLMAVASNLDVIEKNEVQRLLLITHKGLLGELGAIPNELFDGKIVRNLDPETGPLKREHDSLRVLLAKYQDGTLRKFNKDMGEICAAVGAKYDVSGVPPELAPGKEPIFGDYVFSPYRKTSVPFEENTPEEEVAFQALSNHVGGPPIPEEAGLVLMQALDDESYPSILHEPSAEYVFRGMCVSPSQLENLIGEPGSQAGSKPVTKWVGSHETQRGGTSWTVNKTVASGYSFPHPPKTPYAVVLVARVKDNPDTFLEGPGGFYKVKALSRDSWEDESIALGPVKTYRVYWRLGGKVEAEEIQEPGA